MYRQSAMQQTHPKDGKRHPHQQKIVAFLLKKQIILAFDNAARGLFTQCHVAQ
jgi:hypothetical protein